MKYSSIIPSLHLQKKGIPAFFIGILAISLSPSSLFAAITGNGAASEARSGAGSGADSPSIRKAVEIQRMLDKAQPGDTVFIEEGIYKIEDRPIRPVASGKKNAWITIKSRPGKKVIIDGSDYLSSYEAGKEPPQTGLVTFTNCRYLRIEGIEVRQSHNVGILIQGKSTNHIEVVDCRSAGSYNSGISIWYADSCKILHCEITGANDKVLKPEGVPFRGEAPHEALSLAGASHFEVAFNLLHDCLKEGIDCKEISHMGVIHHNTVYNMARQGLYTDCWFGRLSRVEWHHNTVHDCEWGFGVSGEGKGATMDSISFHHNLLYNNRASGIFFSVWGFDQPRSNIFIYNNTLVNNGKAGHWSGLTGGIDIMSSHLKNVFIYDNIVSHNYGYAIGAFVPAAEKDSAFRSRNIRILHNLEWQVTAAAQEPARPHFSAVYPVSGEGAIHADPLFTDAGRGDFSLSEGSPALGMGWMAAPMGKSSYQGAKGVLRVDPKNPRYFTDNGGRPVYLTGSHNWENLQDIHMGPDKDADYRAYLGMMRKNGHNFMRMWMFEQAKMASWTADTISFSPLPFARTGPGLARDGRPKFDLTKYDPAYFRRLRKRIIEAGKNDIYVSVMLFQGWCLDRTGFRIGNPFPYLPYDSANNINGISAPETIEDYDDRPSLHSLKVSAALLAVQEAYVKKVIETVNDLDNVLYEIINEGGATDWQYHMIRYIKQTEAALPHRHPVGMTHRGDKIQHNQDLFDSPADWISPNAEPVAWKYGDSTVRSSYKYDPPAADGRKVILPDTDHLWGHGGTHQWVWKSFLRGLNPIFMDPWNPLPGRENEEQTTGWIYDEGGITRDDRNYPEWSLIRKNMGYARSFARRIDLENMVPDEMVSSTRYCLAYKGHEYLIYFPEGGKATIDLRGVQGDYSVEWFIPLMNLHFPGPRTIPGNGVRVMQPPSSLDAVLYLKKTGE